MALSNFIPTIWAKELDIALRKRYVGLSLVNRDYEGEIRQAGDTVKITRPSAITVGTYTIGSDVTVEAPASAQKTLSIDQQKYFAFDIDDIDAAQANVALMTPYIEEARDAMADTIDQYILGNYTGADSGNVITKATLSTSNIYSKITEAKRRLSVNNAPLQGRWIVFSPYEIELLEKSDEFQRASNLGDDVARNGFVGKAAGFEVYESNNLTEANDGTDDVRHCVFGTRSAVTFAMQLTNLEASRRELQFADLVKGLAVYGSLVVKPKALGDLRAIV